MLKDLATFHKIRRQCTVYFNKIKYMCEYNEREFPHDLLWNSRKSYPIATASYMMLNLRLVILISFIGKSACFPEKACHETAHRYFFQLKYGQIEIN